MKANQIFQNVAPAGGVLARRGDFLQTVEF